MPKRWNNLGWDGDSILSRKVLSVNCFRGSQGKPHQKHPKANLLSQTHNETKRWGQPGRKQD